MARLRSVENLTTEDLRLELLERLQSEQRQRFGHFRRTGRISGARIIQRPRRGTPLPAGDELDGEDAAMESLPAAPRKRTWMDRALLAVEVVAVVGLLFVLLNGFNLLRDLNREVASALAQPTLTPTPLIMAVVLPSGHTPPNSPGGTQPNEAEIPEHLRPLVQSVGSLPAPTSSPQQAIRIQIANIGVDAPVVQGDGWEQLKKGVGQHIGSPNPGQKGNLVLSAHNDVFGEIFRDLDRLKPGDAVTVFTNQRTFSYTVRQTRIVEPTDVEVMAPTQESVVTLISCYPYMVDNKRIVVTATLQQ